MSCTNKAIGKHELYKWSHRAVDDLRDAFENYVQKSRLTAEPRKNKLKQQQLLSLLQQMEEEQRQHNCTMRGMQTQFQVKISALYQLHKIGQRQLTASLDHLTTFIIELQREVGDRQCLLWHKIAWVCEKRSPHLPYDANSSQIRVPVLTRCIQLAVRHQFQFRRTTRICQ